MAKLVPNIPLDSISFPSERDTAKALVSQLPDNVTVFHSYPWLKSERNDQDGKDTLREGEADFVVIIPELGFLVLEVKGGEIIFIPEDRKWYRKRPNGDLRQIKDPFEQACKNKHVIKEKILKYVFPGQESLPCAFGQAVVFPDCNYTGSAPPGADPAIILTERDLPYLDRRIPEILKKWGRGERGSSLTSRDIGKMMEVLKSTFGLIPVLSRQIDGERDVLIKLTDDQARLLDFLALHDRCKIEGVAGSGKTLLAMQQAQRFAKRKMETLLVCYNKALAEWLRETLSDHEKKFIHVIHFHGLCSFICQKSGVPFQTNFNGSTATFFKEEAPELLLQAVDEIGPQYDAIVVDEGQDFESSWWIPLESLGRRSENTPLFLFYDPAQNLFVKESGLPELGKPYQLTKNCRNTRRIAEGCSKVINIQIESYAAAPAGERVIWDLCPDKKTQRARCDEILKRLRGGGVRADQIVILSPSFSSFNGITSIAGYPIVNSFDEWREGRGILYATVRSFKGLEADVVIMADIISPTEQGIFTNNDFYVGMSRARHILAILSRERIESLSKPES
jgi:hypothetical protein